MRRTRSLLAGLSFLAGIANQGFASMAELQSHARQVMHLEAMLAAAERRRPAPRPSKLDRMHRRIARDQERQHLRAVSGRHAWV